MSDKTKKTKKAVPVEAEIEEPLQATEDVLLEDAKESKKSDKGKGKDKAKKSTDDILKGVPKDEIHWKTIDPIIKVSLVVFLLACAVVIGNTIIDKTVADHSGAPVQYGDTVVVDYVGSFYGYYDQPDSCPMVFDTSMASVGNDSAYTKSWEFNKSSYEAISMKIGEGKFLQLFESSVIGHKAGETVRVCIPAADGYGVLTDADEGVKAKTGATVPLSEVLTTADFNNKYGVDSPTSGGSIIVKSPYGWKAQASSDGNLVTVSYIVDVGTEYDMNEKVKLKVTAVGAGTITFDYQFTYEGQMIKAIVDGKSVYITSEEGGNFNFKTTKETVGEDLYFVIKINSIKTTTE